MLEPCEKMNHKTSGSWLKTTLGFKPNGQTPAWTHAHLFGLIILVPAKFLGFIDGGAGLSSALVLWRQPLNHLASHQPLL